MYNFDYQRYENVVKSAIGLRSEIEKAADIVCKEGFSNIFFIGCGGTYAHSLPMKYWLDTESDIESYSMIASEFMVMKHKQFSKDSLCIFSTRSGNTKEIVEAAKFCQDAGARTLIYVSNDNTPVCQYATYKFFSFAEDDCLCEAIYTYMIILLSRILKNRNQFDNYDTFMKQLEELPNVLINAKKTYEKRTEELAIKHKNTDYHMVVGSGMLWGEAYDYAMCILEEMQWIKTKSIHAAEFFHGTLELLEKDTSMILLYGEDETRALMDRVLNFSKKITDNIFIFDTKEIDSPFDAKCRKILSPMIVYAMEERLSCFLERERNHPLTTRRYYRQMEY